jgi:hypothetical protein
VARLSATDALYTVARELERNAFKIDIVHYDVLSIEARSLLGVFLDFHGISREKIANAARGSFTKSAPAVQAGSLFPEDATKSAKPEGSDAREQKQ